MHIFIMMFAYSILPFFVIANHFLSMPISIAIGIILGVGSLYMISKKPILFGAIQLIAACVGAYFVFPDISYGIIFKIVYLVACLPMVFSNIIGFFKIGD